MVFCQCRHSLTFHDNVLLAKEIYSESSFHLLSMVIWMKRHLATIWDIAFFQFHLKPFLIAVFIKAWSQFFMHFMNGTYNIIHVLF